MMERYEEMNRMREHVMNEVDINKDKLISLEEFIASTKKEDFDENEEWEVGLSYRSCAGQPSIQIFMSYLSDH